MQEHKYTLMFAMSWTGASYQGVDTLQQAKRFAESWFEDCDRFGQDDTQSIWVIRGSVEDNRDHSDMYPDYLLSRGPRGGIKCERVC